MKYGPQFRPESGAARPVFGSCKGILTIVSEDEEHPKRLRRVHEMNLLLGSHPWLWFVLGDPQISVSARNHILDPANVKFVSPAN